MTDKHIYPLSFKPQLRDYIWGGRNLETLYGRALPPGLTAESWEISGHPTASTVVDNGALSGWSLPQVLEELGARLVGENARWALERQRFPLLIKLLDANKNLSVQVHPGDDYALTHENGELGKTEMWYVLQARPESKLIFGLKPGVTPESFQKSIAAKTLQAQLHYLPIKSGDAILVQAGSLHALMAGTLVIEIQQNSDLTYRVYDWGRQGSDGKARPLHLDKALEVINFKQVEPGTCPPRLIAVKKGVTRSEISRCDYFVVEKVEFEAGATYQGRTDGSSLEIWGAVEGKAALNCLAADPIDLPAIRFCLVPATLGSFSLKAQTRSTLLRVYLP